MRPPLSSLLTRAARFNASAQRSYTHLTTLSQHSFTRASSKLLFVCSIPALHFSDDRAALTLFTHSAAQPPSLRNVFQDVAGTARSMYINARERLADTAGSEAGKTLLTITAVNTAIYMLWKVAPSSFMIRHFSNSVHSVRQARFWTIFTSNFSHMGMLHLAANMYLLSRFGYDVIDVLGSERFYLFYSTAGVASSLASLMLRRVRKSNSISLGASGAVVATLWLHACFFPDRRMSILGFDRTITMQELVIAYTVFDAAGLLGAFGKIDFAAHIGGAIFANTWFYIVRDKLVQEFVLRKNEKAYWNGHDRSRTNRFESADDL